jgi:hypothetical protein
MEQLLIDILNNLDLTSVSQIDWVDISTYTLIFMTTCGSMYTLSKTFLGVVWQRVEPVAGFGISSLVVFSLWYAILRVHVSVSFNLDKELFDDLLWLSALTFTPYYLARYALIEQTFIFIWRTLELLVDLAFFSWFEEIAKMNRLKWSSRVRVWRYRITSSWGNQRDVSDT